MHIGDAMNIACECMLDTLHMLIALDIILCMHFGHFIVHAYMHAVNINLHGLHPYSLLGISTAKFLEALPKLSAWFQVV